MRKVIDRKVYDTQKAKLIHGWDNGRYGSDFHCLEERLYRTARGAYFVVGTGGALTGYRRAAGDNSWSGGSDIWVLSRDEAIEWLEEHEGHSALEEHFGEDLQEG